MWGGPGKCTIVQTRFKGDQDRKEREQILLDTASIAKKCAYSLRCLKGIVGVLKPIEIGTLQTLGEINNTHWTFCFHVLTQSRKAL
jgi:hypothetical protein